MTKSGCSHGRKTKYSIPYKGSPRILLPPVRDLIEGLALRKPRRSVAGIMRIVADAARERGWAVPSYTAVRAVVNGLDPALLVLAHRRGTEPLPGCPSPLAKGRSGRGWRGSPRDVEDH